MTSSKQNVCLALPKDAASRKNLPITSGVLDYFPMAIAAVAAISKAGNDQHNPGQPMHWNRGKSSDHADCIARHLIQRGDFDTDGMRHSAKLAWRALALLQEELEAETGFKPVPEGVAPHATETKPGVVAISSPSPYDLTGIKAPRDRK